MATRRVGMLWTALKDLRGMPVALNQRRLGRVVDLYIDGERWSVRYIVVRTGRWPFSGPVLFEPLTHRVRRPGGAEEGRAMQSAMQLFGFRVLAGNDIVGRVQNVLVDEDRWTVPGIVVAGRRLMRRDYAFIAADAVQAIDVGNRRLAVALA